MLNVTPSTHILRIYIYVSGAAAVHYSSFVQAEPRAHSDPLFIRQASQQSPVSCNPTSAEALAVPLAPSNAAALPTRAKELSK